MNVAGSLTFSVKYLKLLIWSPWHWARHWWVVMNVPHLVTSYRTQVSSKSTIARIRYQWYIYLPGGCFSESFYINLGNWTILKTCNSRRLVATCRCWVSTDKISTLKWKSLKFSEYLLDEKKKILRKNILKISYLTHLGILFDISTYKHHLNFKVYFIKNIKWTCLEPTYTSLGYTWWCRDAQ